MPGSPTPPTTDPSSVIDPELLESLLTVLLAGTDLDPGDPPRLVRLRVGADDLDPGELEIGLRALVEGGHPLEDLVGFRAPEDWSALGVLATGRASHLADDTTRRRSSPPVPVALGQLVARDGSWASAWRPLIPATPEAPPLPEGSECGPAATGLTCTGRVDDALRRALAVPTAPPPASTHVLWATQWLDAVVALGGRRGRHRLTSSEVLALHPAVTALDIDPAGLTIGRLVAEGDRLAGWRGWAELRRSCATGAWPEAGVDDDLATWFDDGSYARWLLGRWPELPDLLEAIGALLAPSAAAGVGEALVAWGLVADAADPAPGRGPR